MYKLESQWRDDESLWDIKVKWNTVTFTRLEPIDTQEPNEIICKRNNKSKNCLKDWEDWTYTVYHNRDWQPLYFSPVLQE
jgi:hypothetical protein